MTCFVYHEGEDGKGANDVISFLKYYIDNCCDQNKNNTMIRFLMSLVELRRFEEIQIYFPARGHSFMPCDRDFGLIKKTLNKTERLYTTQEYIEVITKASNKPRKFFIVPVTRYDIRL